MNRRYFIALVVCIAHWPLASRAQQLGKVHHVAIVHPTLSVSRMMTESGLLQRVFLTELKQLGYVEGVNLIVDCYSGEGRTLAGLKELAEDAVRGGPDVIVTVANDVAEINPSPPTRSSNEAARVHHPCGS